MPNLRLFWALEIGAAARARAAGIAAALRDQPGDDGVRWVREESLHVTLRFLGATDPARVADLEREVERATRGISPFAVSLAGTVLFPSPRRARVVALELSPADPLGTLAARIERGAVAAGFPPEPRAFRPHLTLGRARDRRGIRLAVTASVTAHGDAWDVTETVLFRSDLAPGGARYTPLARVPLHP